MKKEIFLSIIISIVSFSFLSCQKENEINKGNIQIESVEFDEPVINMTQNKVMPIMANITFSDGYKWRKELSVIKSNDPSIILPYKNGIASLNLGETEITVGVTTGEQDNSLLPKYRGIGLSWEGNVRIKVTEETRELCGLIGYVETSLYGIWFDVNPDYLNNDKFCFQDETTQITIRGYYKKVNQERPILVSDTEVIYPKSCLWELENQSNSTISNDGTLTSPNLHNNDLVKVQYSELGKNYSTIIKTNRVDFYEQINK